MATTNLSKVDRLALRLRVGVATRLMDRVGYAEVRAWLEGEGVAATDLPSDRTLRDYLKGAEATGWARQRAAEYLREAPGDGLATLEERVSLDNQARGLCMALDELQDRLRCSSELRARLAMVREHVEDAEYQLEKLRDGAVAPESPAYVEAAENLAYWLTRQARLMADPDRLPTGMTLRVVSQTIRLMDRAVALSREERETREAAQRPAAPVSAGSGMPGRGPAMAPAMADGSIRQDSVGIRQDSAAPSPSPATAAPGRSPAMATHTAGPAAAPHMPAVDGGNRQHSVGIRQGSAAPSPSPATGAPKGTVVPTAPEPETADRAPANDSTSSHAGLNRAQRRALKRRRETQRSATKGSRS